jgi:penicillin-binding protein 1A
MKQAVANRPVEPFENEVKMPDWQIEGGEEAWEGEPDDFLMVDPDGNPIVPEGSAAPPVARQPQAQPEVVDEEREIPGDQLNQEWLDRVTGRTPPPPREPPPRRPPPPQLKRSEPPDPVERSTFPTQP